MLLLLCIEARRNVICLQVVQGFLLTNFPSKCEWVYFLSFIWYFHSFFFCILVQPLLFAAVLVVVFWFVTVMILPALSSISCRRCRQCCLVAFQPQRKRVAQTKESGCVRARTQWHKRMYVGDYIIFDEKHKRNTRHRTNHCDYTTNSSVIDAFVLCVMSKQSNYFYVYEYLNWNLISLQTINAAFASQTVFESYQNLSWMR